MELEKQTELVNQNTTVLDPRVIKEKEEEILREIEMEQELRRREIRSISALINKNSRKVRRSREEMMQGLEMKSNS